MRLYIRFSKVQTFGIVIICSYIWILLILKLLNYHDWYTWCNRLQNRYLQLSSIDLGSSCHLRTANRDIHQRIIAVSMFGPKENELFQLSLSISFLNDLIQDVAQVYPGWILRVYHDNSIDIESIRQIQCHYDYVDFYNMTDRSFPPPRMWRFLSIGDLLVDIMLIRDLDSPLTHRERAAVDDWLVSNKILHIMRDHPLHYDFILAGMWGFRSESNRKLSRLIFDKLQNATIMEKYVGKGDQPFLLNELWPFVENDSIIHDSFHCQRFQDNSIPFPTRRPSVKGSNIFVGCVKPCAENQFTLGECPIDCRPKNHREWIYC